MSRIPTPAAALVAAAVAGVAMAASHTVGEADLTVTSIAPSSFFAESAAIVGDVDGDGHGDFAVGAVGFDAEAPGGGMILGAGSVVVYSGASGEVIDVLAGNETGSNLGISVIAVPDRDGDGVGEIVAGAPGIANGGVKGAGGFLIFSGATGELLDTVRGEVGAEMNLGFSLATVGDITGDGYPEIFAGANGLGDQPEAANGAAVLYDGANLTVMHTFVGEQPGSIFGCSVAGPGDVDGDGSPDLLVGAFLTDITSPVSGQKLSDAGRAYVFSGADYALIHSVERYTDEISTGKANFGTSVSGVGDVDGDGRPDFVVGAPENQQGSGGNGSMVVFSGLTGDVIFDIEGAFTTGEQLGAFVLGLPDVDGDGTPDFAGHSAQTCFGFCSSGPGKLTIYSGANASILETYSGAAPKNTFGASVAAGDLNGDGGLDLVIGAPFAAAPENTPGLVYVFHGEPVATPCPADIAGGDGVIDSLDLNALLASFGGDGPGAGIVAPFDFCDSADLNALLAVFGGSCR